MHWESVNEYNRNLIRKNIGILSLGQIEDNFLMWSHYTNSHWGYCVGFDKFKLYEACNGAIGAVVYETEFPKHNIFQDTFEFMLKSLFIKSKVWEYEKEWRITKNGMARQIINFNKEAISEIIFGVNMEHKIKLELLEFVEQHYPKSRVYEMSLNKNEFKLDKNQIR